MPSKNIGEALYDFQNKYGFTERFDDLEAKGRATAAPFKHLDSFLWTSDGISYESRQYLLGWTYMLNKYVNDKLKPEYGDINGYDLGNLNVMDFVNEYENIIQLKHPNSPRKPYDGIEVEVLKTAERFSKDLSRPLIDIWADKIKEGTFSLSAMREVTNNAYISPEKNRIKATAIIHDALQKIADNRSLGERLNPLNWPRMIQEYRYRNEVSSILEKNKGVYLSIREELSDARRAPLLDPKMAEDIGKLREAKEAEIKLQREKNAEKKAQDNEATKQNDVAATEDKKESPVEREQVFNNEHPFVEDSKKAEPIKEVPQKDVPTATQSK